MNTDPTDFYKISYSEFKTMIDRGYDPCRQSDWERYRLGLHPFTEPEWQKLAVNSTYGKVLNIQKDELRLEE